MCVSRNRLCKCLSALAVMAFLCLRGATSFHWLNKIFFHLFNLNRGCVLSFLTPSPLSLTHTHTFLYTVLQRTRHQSKVFGMRQRCWQICDCLLACVRVCARACTLANHLVMSLYTCPCSLYLIQTRGSVDLLLPLSLSSGLQSLVNF